MAAACYVEHAFKNITGWTRSEAADVFVHCWKGIESYIILSAWNFENMEPFEYSTDEDDEDETAESESFFDRSDSETSCAEEVDDDAELILQIETNRRIPNSSDSDRVDDDPEMP